MNECFKCGLAENKVRLFDAIYGKGIVKICKECSFQENILIIKRPTSFQLKESEANIEKEKTVYERLSDIAGINPEEHKKKISDETIKKQELLKKQEITLKDIVDKTFKPTIPEKAKPREDLIDNFHWIIMRARRSKKITQTQLARGIAESEAAIKMAEQGILPENSYRLIDKLEAYFGIRIRKKEVSGEVVQQPSQRILDFEPLTTKTLTIADLKAIKEKKEAEVLWEKRETKERVEQKKIEKDLEIKDEDLEGKNDL